MWDDMCSEACLQNPNLLNRFFLLTHSVSFGISFWMNSMYKWVWVWVGGCVGVGGWVCGCGCGCVSI